MSILSSILGIGGNQPQPVAGPALATQKIPEELAPYYKDILGKAQALYKEKTAEGFQPYQGPTIAQFTPEQEQAFTGLAGLAGQQAPVFTEAMDMTRAAAAPMTSEQVTEYMSPYQQAVVDIEKREAQKQYESQVVPQLAAQAATTGGFGGSRQAILEGMAADTQQRLLGDIQAKGSQQAYEDAVRRFQTDRQASGQAGAQLAQMAPAQFKAELGEFGALQTVGEQRQRQAQTALDEAFRQYTREQEYPYTTLGRYQATVTGAPIGTTQFAAPTPPPPTLGQTLIGGLGTAAGLYGQFTGKNPLSLITGKKHGGGLSDLPVVNAQDGLYLRRGISARNPYEKYMVPVQLGTVYDDEGIYRLQGEEENKEDPSAPSFTASIEEIMALQDEANVDPKTMERLDRTGILRPNMQNVTAVGPDGVVVTERETPGRKKYFGQQYDKPVTDTDIDRIMGFESEENKVLDTKLPPINQPPNEGGLPNMVTQTPQLDRGMIQSELDYMKGEDDIAKAQQAYLDNLANRDKLLAEREADIEDQRTRDQYGNLASFFSRMATATPRRGGLLGVLDASMQVAPESIQAMKDTNKEIRDRMENIQNQRQDLETLKLKEDLGMKLSKTERQTARRKEKELNKNTKETLKLEKKKIELMEDQIEADLEIAMAKGLDVGPSDHAELRQTFKDFRDRPGLFLPPDKVMEARELEAQARNILNKVGSSVYYSDYHNDVVQALTALYQKKSDKKIPNENQQSEEEQTVILDE